MDPGAMSLDELCDYFAQKARERKMGPVRLKPAYVEAVLRIDALPQNQGGVDKSWVEQAWRSEQQLFANVRRIR